jgi:NAD(P)H-hydrate epimerase
MKVLTAAQMREADRLSTERYAIPSLLLMENAGTRVVEFLEKEFPDLGKRRITIVCGKGNNGGDGLVVARQLLMRGITSKLVLLGDADELKGDARTNYTILAKAGFVPYSVRTLDEWIDLKPDLLGSSLVIDAILGTGLAGPAEGLYLEVIRDINASFVRSLVVAVDIPSGLASDTGESLGESVRADYTVTFTAPKVGQVFPPNCEQVGKLAVVPIGTPREALDQDASVFLNLIDAQYVKQVPLHRRAAAHKGDFGHALLIAGSKGKTGAAALAARAALRAGAGLVTVATPASMLPSVASMLGEMMTEPLPDTDAGTISSRAAEESCLARILEGKSVVALGPGITTHAETVAFVHKLLASVSLPLLVDADGLNAFAGCAERLLARKSPALVLTPHPGEMGRLVGMSAKEVQSRRMEVARDFAMRHKVHVILKGYRTLVAAPSGQVFVNPTGNPGMATGGAGDVLTGLLAGLIAQFGIAHLDEVLCLGVYLHGLAGDLAASERSEAALMASDITEAFPRAVRILEQEQSAGPSF